MGQKFKQVKGGFFCVIFFFSPPFFFFLFSFSQLEPELGYTLSGFTCLSLELLLTKNTSMNSGKVFSVKSGWDAPLTKVTHKLQSLLF